MGAAATLSAGTLIDDENIKIPKRFNKLKLPNKPQQAYDKTVDELNKAIRTHKLEIKKLKYEKKIARLELKQSV